MAKKAATSKTVRTDSASRVRRAVQRPGNTSELGATGTPNYGGYITGEDYNADLDGQKGMQVYDKMRRSDAQVQASLEVLKQPLLSGTWEIQPPSDATPQEEEIAAYCQEALFGQGAMSDPWSYTLEHILLMLDFGNSPLEKVFALGEDGRIRYQRLAPRLPRTIERFDVDDDGRLLQIMQYAVKGGRFMSIDIPADYLAMFVHRREGDNYWGRSVLRSAYQHWFYKTDAYRTLGVQRHRFGVGIPRAVTKADASFTPEELAAIDQILENMVAHEKAWMRHSDKFAIDIMMPGGRGPSGSGGGQSGGGRGGNSSIADVEHHNMMIARNVLADFMQGSGDGLNSSRTRSLIEFFISALYDKAGTICGTLTTDVVVPLCVLNFTMQGNRFPKVVASDLADVDLKGLTEQLSRLGPEGFITPTDDDETMLRKLMGLPPLPKQFLGMPRQRKQPAPPAPGAPPPPETFRLRQTKPGRTFELHGRVYARRPTDLETRIFSVTEVPDQLDLEVKALTAALVDIRRRQLDTLAAQIAKKDARKTAPFTDIRPEEFSVPLKAEVQRELKASLVRVAEFGARQVQLELHRQGAPIALTRFVDDVFALDINPSAAASKRAVKSALTTSAKVTTEQLTDSWFNRILETGVRLRRAGEQGEALARAIVSTLSPEIESGVARVAKGEVNEGFALGRAAEAASHADEIETVEYSCLLDANSCVPCADEDGTQFAYGSAEYYRTLPPFKDCDGNKGTPDACRCVHLYLWKGSN